MVCIACLLPLFLIPIVNFLPILFDFIMGKVYGLLGWEYRKPARVAPACPMKPRGTSTTKPPNHDVHEEANEQKCTDEAVPLAPKEE